MLIALRKSSGLEFHTIAAGQGPLLAESTSRAATGLQYHCVAFVVHNFSDVVDSSFLHYAWYYDGVMQPHAAKCKSVLNAVRKTSGLELHAIAPWHGPMLAESTSIAAISLQYTCDASGMH